MNGKVYCCAKLTAKQNRNFQLQLILLLSMNNLLAQLKATNDTQQTQISSNNHINSSNNEPISDGFLKQALSDSRYLRRQLKCVLGEIPCDLVGRRLKSMFLKLAQLCSP